MKTSRLGLLALYLLKILLFGCTTAITIGSLKNSQIFVLNFKTTSIQWILSIGFIMNLQIANKVGKLLAILAK